MELVERRRSKITRRCSTCGRFIKSGSLYLRYRERVGRVWSREALAECSTCATKYGRAGLLEEKEK